MDVERLAIQKVSETEFNVDHSVNYSILQTR